MLKQKYFLTGIFILSAERQPIKLSWRKIVWLHTWYMSVKDKVADWYNMRSGEALCRYRVMNKDELLQEIYSDNLFIALAT